MEFVCVILCLMLGSCAAVPQDLRGKMFTFPQESEKDFVKVDLDRNELSSFTVCMRVFTDLLTPHNLFLLTTNSSHNPRDNLLISNYPQASQYYMSYNGTIVYFNSNFYKINRWQSLCASWTAQNGIVRLWIDGQRTGRKFLSQTNMTSPMAVIIGQGVGARPFYPRAEKCFCGMVSDLHMWDFELSPAQIQNFGPFTAFPQGNILSWYHLDFKTYGRVLLES